MALLGFSLLHALAYGFTGNGDGFTGNGFPELRRPRGGAQKLKKNLEVLWSANLFFLSVLYNLF